MRKSGLFRHLRCSKWSCKVQMTVMLLIASGEYRSKTKKTYAQELVDLNYTGERSWESAQRNDSCLAERRLPRRLIL